MTVTTNAFTETLDNDCIKAKTPHLRFNIISRKA